MVQLLPIQEAIQVFLIFQAYCEFFMLDMSMRYPRTELQGNCLWALGSDSTGLGTVWRNQGLHLEIWQVSSGCTHFGKTRNTDNKLTHRCLLGLVTQFSRFSYPSLLYLTHPTRPRHKSLPYLCSWIHVPTSTTRSAIFPCYYRKKYMRTSYLCCKGCRTSQIFRVSLEAHFVPWCLLLRDFSTCPPFVSLTNKVQLP